MRELLGLTIKELKEIIVELGEPNFRAAQIIKWLCSLTPFSEMKNLPETLRKKLTGNFSEGYGETAQTQTSKDGTKKFLIRFDDGACVEVVLMSYHHGNTVCISTQAGCAMGCVFCKSGENGLLRNLDASEMLYSVLAANAECATKMRRGITNVVLMGVGEPLDNYDNVIKFLRLINSSDYLNIGARNISLSTCGLVPEMKKLGAEGLQINLCLSLHSAFDDVRQSIMPINKRYPVGQALDALFYYSETTGRRVIIEYILFDGLNDNVRDIDELAKILNEKNALINVIRYNYVGGELRSPNASECEAFVAKLNDRGLNATLRRSLGQDINGACGQLISRDLTGEKIDS